MASMKAETSFLPPCRAIMTEKVRPLRNDALRMTALAISSWYGLRLSMVSKGLLW